FIGDGEARLLTANTEALRRAERESSDLFQALPEIEQILPRAQYADRVIRNGETVRGTISLRTPPGETLSITISPLPTATGSGALVVLEDRSELTRERERRERAE